MKITDLLLKDIMIMDMQSTEKEQAIDEMIGSLYKNHIINNKEIFKEAILNRESQSSTGLGDGIAMPHAKSKAVKKPTVLFAKSNKGINYDSLDGQPAYLFFMIAVPEAANDTHLQTLAALSKMLIDADFVNQLKQAETHEDVHVLFNKTRENPEEITVETSENSSSKRPFIVAVTACPTGIAHTYMAEDALKKKAVEMNVDIRVETNGSDGVKNELTADEIKRADAVIVAASKKVELHRFNGKKLLNRPVSEGIKKTEELITKAINQDAPTYHAEQYKERASSKPKSKTILGTIYKDLMNGISHMLPFVIGGGILMAISFLFESVLGSDSETFTFLNELGSNAFNFLIPIFAGFIAMSIADRPGLMPGMVGGLIAVNSDAGFIGGLVAGFLAGYIIILLKRLLHGLPRSLDGLKSILIYPVLGLLLTGILMYFIFGPIFAGINTVMVDFLQGLGTRNAVIVGALLGGMMAIDMGGPFNKAAYAFSIGIFTDTGDGSLMAAVMAGGMVPPLAIALSSTIFKEKFNEDERKSGATNYVMGLSFITEGAIPFAAADPLRVIGSSVIGAAIAGGLTQLWNSAIPAPHGGIFVIPLAENALFFLLSLAIGTVVAAIILGFWRKPA